MLKPAGLMRPDGLAQEHPPSSRPGPWAQQVAPLNLGHIRVDPGTWMDPDTDLQPLLERCDEQQWHLEIPPAVTRQWRYFSGTDRQRITDLSAAWNDPTVDAVLTLGGGWGAARVLEAGFRFPPRPKWSLGFSDTSSLLLAQWAAGSGGADASVSGSAPGTPGGASAGGKTWEPTRPLVVTNLTVATHLIGTRWLPSLKGAILVLEDVGEAPYRVDRMLTQWRSAGLFQHLAGVACGRFSWAKDDILPGDFTMEEILEERLGDLGIPLVLNLPVGHGRPNQALPLGSQAQLDGQRGLLSLIP